MERIVSFEEAKLLAELEFKENVDKVYDTNKRRHCRTQQNSRMAKSAKRKRNRS